MSENRREGVRVSKGVQRSTGKTFHLATRLLPERVRHPTYVLYAFFRLADEVVDKPDQELGESERRQLEGIKQVALGDATPEEAVSEGAVLSADTDREVLNSFREVKEEFDLSDTDVDEFIESMKADIDTKRYETYSELEGYMRGSAVSVGRMMTDVMVEDASEETYAHAEALGEAFQMTNFLRDVREDITDYGRIYIPRETLREANVAESEVEKLEHSPEFADAVRAELRRTDNLYREGVEGIKLLPKDCQFAVLVASVLYSDYHRLIEKRGYDVLTQEPSLGSLRKLRLVAETYYRWKTTDEPEEVFYEVSPVSQRYSKKKSKQLATEQPKV
ncbi:MAG: phytoene/squalene synthase family protein [Halobacteria archaeon]|nr:phytoene/squalene synthase family protein [Halobacteria archaeon]